jgi:hypothetical protein
MATEATKDALIDLNSVPARQQANLKTVETPQGTVVTNKGSVSGLVAFVKGPATFLGGNFRKATFNFSTAGSTPPSVDVRNTELTGASFNGTTANDDLGFGGNNPLAKSSSSTKVNSASASLGAGEDSVSFKKGSKDSKSSYDMGQGADSVTFNKGSFSDKTTISLGSNDGAADIVDVSSQKVVEKLKIKDFGVNDTLRVGSKTYDYSDLQAKDGKLGNIRVSFD